MWMNGRSRKKDSSFLKFKPLNAWNSKRGDGMWNSSQNNQAIFYSSFLSNINSFSNQENYMNPVFSSYFLTVSHCQKSVRVIWQNINIHKNKFIICGFSSMTACVYICVYKHIFAYIYRIFIQLNIQVLRHL